MATYLLNSTKLKPIASMQGRAERHQMYILISKNALAHLIQVHVFSQSRRERSLYLLTSQMPETKYLVIWYESVLLSR